MATKTATSTKVTPLADRVVVKPLEEAEQMRGGLYIPDTAKEKPQQGEIVAVGPGRYRGREAHSARREGRGQGALREVQRHRGHHRWRAGPDPSGVGRAGSDWLSATQPHRFRTRLQEDIYQWLARNCISIRTRARR